MPNRLAHETSPYLLQHRDNPVDWYPWGEEALARARELERPLLVSIGYSACHWCHVMERESFEDESVARLMNESFVCVKVDREERPDVDAVCMEACQGMTGHGGWPLNVFLTPEQQPFFAGTYFPPQARPGMPSWSMLLGAVADAWDQRRDEIRAQGAKVAAALGASARRRPGGDEDIVAASIVADCVEALRASYDAERGGWGGAPKFPAADTIEFLLGAGEREMSLGTLEAMAAGGIHDQLAGGFARYSVDATWTVPHFEKMLYDNALLARAYLHGWQVSGSERLREVCCSTLDWALSELRGPEGGFCSSLDADSEGVEGKFYAWSDAELRSVLGSTYDEAIAYFQPKPFEHGTYVLEGRGAPPPNLAEVRRRLLAARSCRVRPGLDDKRLTGWNALMVSALADAGGALGRTDYLDAARACASFLLTSMRDGEGRLLRTWKDGRARLAGYLEDHAFLLQALLVLYEATFEGRWYTEAVTLADVMLAKFHDGPGGEGAGGFFTTAAGEPVLVARRRDLEDAPIPSGNSAAALGLLRLARLSGESRYEQAATSVMRLHGPIAARHPSAFGHLLQAISFYLAPAREVAVVGSGADDGADALARVARERFRPFEVLAGGAPRGVAGALDSGGDVPLLEGRVRVGGRAAAYVCEHFACRAPVTEPDALAVLLRP